MYNQKIFVHVPENICVCCVVRDKDKAGLLNKRRRDHSPAPGSGSEPEDSISYIEGYNYNKIYTQIYPFTLNTLLSLFLALTGHNTKYPQIYFAIVHEQTD